MSDRYSLVAEFARVHGVCVYIKLNNNNNNNRRISDEPITIDYFIMQ